MVVITKTVLSWGPHTSNNYGLWYLQQWLMGFISDLLVIDWLNMVRNALSNGGQKPWHFMGFKHEMSWLVGWQQHDKSREIYGSSLGFLGWSSRENAIFQRWGQLGIGATFPSCKWDDHPAGKAPRVISWFITPSDHRCPKFPLVGWLIEGFETTPNYNR